MTPRRGRLVCASCNPNRKPRAFSARTGCSTPNAGEGLGLLVDRPEIWHERWLAGSVPGWDFNITTASTSALYQPRYLSDSGRLFFDSPDALVPAGHQRQGGRLRVRARTASAAAQSRAVASG